MLALRGLKWVVLQYQALSAATNPTALILLKAKTGLFVLGT